MSTINNSQQQVASMPAVVSQVIMSERTTTLAQQPQSVTYTSANSFSGG